MELVVVDTDVVSFLAKSDSRASLYSPLLDNKKLCICFQTVAELKLWTAVRRLGPARMAALDSLIKRFPVLPYNYEVAEKWAEVTAHRRFAGQPIECGDAWIAASALTYSATLVSHNAKHYENIPGLRLISHG